MEQRGWRLWIKKAVDKVAAASVLFATAPIIGCAAVAVRSTMGSPVLFRQTRPGYRGRPFEIIKFRTMSQPGTGSANDDGSRLTPLGRFLRKTSIDELPQLWCVLRGDLSLVGPRPLLMEYLDRYTAEEKRRHDVLPGITGLAVVNGRNLLSWEEKFRFDVAYVESWSLALDARILARTVVKVLSREGVSSTTSETMPELRPR